MSTTLASAVSTRIEALIALYHHGDRFAAAHRLGVPPEQLADLLSGDWRRFSLDALAALVRGYGVNVGWLLAPPGGGAGVSARRPRRTRAGEPSGAGGRVGGRVGGRASEAASVLDVSAARRDDALGA